MHSYFSLVAVEAVLRGDETPPSRLDSISVKETPPPVPNTPRPRPPPPQTPPLVNEDRLPNKQSHSHFHRALPAPPTVSRTKEFGGRSMSPNAMGLTKSMENLPPLPPNRPGSPHMGNNTQSHNSSKPPPPRRPQIPPPSLPKSNQTSPPPSSSERPAPPRRPKPPLPRRPSNLSSSTSPPPPPSNKPVISRGSSRQDSSLTLSYNIDLTASDSIQDMISNLQNSAPDILTAMKDRHNRVPQFLEELANLTESIVDTAQSSSGTKTISFRTMITSLRGDFAILRNVKGPLWQRNEEKVTKCVNDIVKKVSQLSSHLG